jgi:methyl-accepting chemotaxis protein
MLNQLVRWFNAGNRSGDDSPSLERVVKKTRRSTIDLAIGAQKLVLMARNATSSAQEQKNLAQKIQGRSEQTVLDLSEVSTTCSDIAQSTREYVGLSRQYSNDLRDTRNILQAVNEQIRLFSDSVRVLHDHAQAVSEIVQMINQVSKQTTLLSYNAAVEATRAGDAGKGFAVVAAEIRDLANRVRESAESISGRVDNMMQQSADSKKEIQKISIKALDANQSIQVAVGHFVNMIEGLQGVNDRVLGIDAAMKTLHQRTRDDCQQVQEISALSDQVLSGMLTASEGATDLVGKTEALQNLAAHVDIGDQIDRVIQYGFELRRQVEAILSDLNKSSMNVLDRDYQEVANSRPQKYRTAYDLEFEKRVQPLYDRALEQLGCLFYCNALDINGYVPAHNSKYSAPLTGRYEVDLIHSRSKRIMTDATSQRAVKHQQKFLLQTYLRDNGDVVSDISIPLFVAGTHWGGLRLGVDSNKLTE